jgi:uncharacterized membrane protein
MVGLGFLDPTLGGSFATGVSSDGSTIAGNSIVASGEEGFYYSGGTMQGIGFQAGASSSQVNGLSENGKVAVGSSYIDGNTTEAFAWSLSGGLTPLGYLPGINPAKIKLFSEANAVSEDGNIMVGEADDASGAIQAVVWRRGAGMVTLASLLQNSGVSSASGFSLWDAVGVSAGGSVIDGWGRDSNGKLISWTAEINPQAVPEPGPSIALCAGLGAVARRRKRLRPASHA